MGAEVWSLLEQRQWRNHPLGFVYLSGHTPDGFGLRLHLWGHASCVAQSPLLPIHDHVFHLRSTVICGSMTAIRWQTDFLDSGSFEPYLARYDRSISVLQATGGRCTLLDSNSIVVDPGQAYEVPPGEFHESRPTFPEGLTITLVRTSPPNLMQPRVLVPVNARLPSEIRFARSLVSIAIRDDLSRLAIEALRHADIGQVDSRDF